MKKTFLLFFVVFFSFCYFTNAATYVITVTNNKFTPANAPAISMGDTVIWDFLEGRHTTTSGVACTPNGIWDSGNKDSGTTFMRVFDSSGSFPYFCTPHCGDAMVGQITVNATSGIAENNLKNNTVSFSAYPNPFNNTSIFQYELKKPASVVIELMDISGKIVAVVNPPSNIGINRSQLITEELPEGIYVARLITNGVITENRLLIKQK